MSESIPNYEVIQGISSGEGVFPIKVGGNSFTTSVSFGTPLDAESSMSDSVTIVVT